MRKNLRRLGWAVVPVLGVTLAACRNYDVKYAPFNPRQLQENERMSTGPGVTRPDRPLPTTLEVEFPMPTGNGTTRSATAAIEADNRSKFPPATGPAIPSGGERIVRMPIRELVQRAVANNLDVKVAGYTPAIEQTRVTEAEARFDPTFFTNVQYSQENVLGPSATNINAQIDQTTFRTYSAQIGLRQDLESGGRVEARYEPAHTERAPNDTSGFGTSINPNPFWTSDLTLQITQPLLRDYGADVNRARITINRNNQRIGLLDYRTELEKNISDVERAHWQLVQAMRDVVIAEDLLNRTIATGEIIFKRTQHEAGRQQLSQANASIETRRTILIRARSRVRDLSDQLKRLLNDPEFPVAGDVLILPADGPLLEEVQFNERDQIDTALENRVELGQQQLRVDNAGVAADVAKNNLLPQLNFVGSVGFKGLGSSWDESVREQWEFNAIDYTIGVQLEIPIGNRAARAIWKRAQLQRLQAIDQYRALIDEVSLNVRQALRQVQTTWDEIYGTRRATLASADALQAIEDREKAEAAGLSPEFVNRKLDLQAELAQNQSREAEAMSNYMIAISELERAKGTLLRYNNIVMEETALGATEATTSTH